ncbi:hypothetical protein LG288_04550 [Idiomarina seosinensis]|uniref:hypothetical protein n=1 Tax=Idiomarina seosinensis TaxID=281739 RepID=UPI0038513E79
MLKQKIWPLALGLIGLTTAASAVYADEQAISEYQFAVNDATELSIDSGVAEVEFIRGEAGEVQIELTVKKTKGSLLPSDPDIHGVTLVSDWRGNQLQLSVSPDDDIHTHWRVTLPKMAAIDVDVGVGEIYGAVDTTDTRLNLGVGKVELALYGDDISRIFADVGIGKSSVSGMTSGDIEQTRAIVSSETEARGNGRYRISADVGVGDAGFTVFQLK